MVTANWDKKTLRIEEKSDMIRHVIWKEDFHCCFENGFQEGKWKQDIYWGCLSDDSGDG
jgi:hypothetical protein